MTRSCWNRRLLPWTIWPTVLDRNVTTNSIKSRSTVGCTNYQLICNRQVNIQCRSNRRRRWARVRCAVSTFVSSVRRRITAWHLANSTRPTNWSCTSCTPTGRTRTRPNWKSGTARNKCSLWSNRYWPNRGLANTASRVRTAARQSRWQLILMRHLLAYFIYLFFWIYYSL